MRFHGLSWPSHILIYTQAQIYNARSLGNYQSILTNLCRHKKWHAIRRGAYQLYARALVSINLTDLPHSRLVLKSQGHREIKIRCLCWNIEYRFGFTVRKCVCLGLKHYWHIETSVSSYKHIKIIPEDSFSYTDSSLIKSVVGKEQLSLFDIYLHNKTWEIYALCKEFKKLLLNHISI